MRGYAGDETTGFQSPAQDHIEPVVDLAALLDLRRPHLYPVRVVGQALAGARHPARRRAGGQCRRRSHCRQSLCRHRRRRCHPRDARLQGWWLVVEAVSREPKPVADDVEIWAIVEALVRFKV